MVEKMTLADELAGMVATASDTKTSLNPRDVGTWVMYNADRILAALRTPAPDDLPDLGGGVVIDLDRAALEMLGEAAAQSNWIPPEYMANDWLADCATFLRTGQGATPQPTRNEVLEEAAQVLKAIMNAHASNVLFHNRTLAERAWEAIASLSTPTEQSRVLTVDQPSEEVVEDDDTCSICNDSGYDPYMERRCLCQPALTKGQQP